MWPCHCHQQTKQCHKSVFIKTLSSQSVTAPFYENLRIMVPGEFSVRVSVRCSLGVFIAPYPESATTPCSVLPFENTFNNKQTPCMSQWTRWSVVAERKVFKLVSLWVIWGRKEIKGKMLQPLLKTILSLCVQWSCTVAIHCATVPRNFLSSFTMFYLRESADLLFSWLAVVHITDDCG